MVLDDFMETSFVAKIKQKKRAENIRWNILCPLDGQSLPPGFGGCSPDGGRVGKVDLSVAVF
jgi:hypothetical protein